MQKNNRIIIKCSDYEFLRCFDNYIDGELAATVTYKDNQISKSNIVSPCSYNPFSFECGYVNQYYDWGLG